MLSSNKWFDSRLDLLKCSLLSEVRLEKRDHGKLNTLWLYELSGTFGFPPPSLAA